MIDKLIVGEYYRVNWNNKYDYIFKYNSRGNSNYIADEKTYGILACFNVPEYWSPIRPANFKEIKWLNACIKANKYVDCPKDEIINDYQII